jgi:hypothetical protein
MQETIRTVGLTHQEGSTMVRGQPGSWRDEDKKKPQPTRKPIGVTKKVYITSLNSHFAKI